MVPRLKLSDVGSTSFWLNATDSNVFPSTLNDTLVRSSCANISGQPSLNSCPSSGWEALAGFVSLSIAGGLHGPPGSNWDRGEAEDFINSSSSHNVIDLLGSYATRSMYRTTDNDGPFPLMTTQHAALAEALFVISQMWNVLTQSSKDAYLAGASSHTLSAWQPYGAVFCTSNYTINNASDTRPIPFFYTDLNSSDLMKTNRSGLLQTLKNETKPSLLILDLDSLHSTDPDLQDVTLGAVILESNTNFSTCIVHAGWASTYLNLSTGSVESPSKISTLSNRSVEISPSWAEYLNPVTDNSGNRVFGSLFSFFNGDRNQQLAQLDPTDQIGAGYEISDAYERILAALVTNGLANVYIDSTLQGDLTDAALCDVTMRDNACDLSKQYSSDPAYFKAPSEAKSLGWNEWQVKHSVWGLAYSSEGIIIKIYIVILLIYAAVVVLYSLYSLAMGLTSSPWRSVSELTTLALVSPQPDKGLNEFHSTSTGIYGLGVFEKNVRVVAVDEGQGADHGREELQLVFGKKMPLGYKKVVPNGEYGASP